MKECRYLPKFELRAASQGNDLMLVGYAAKFSTQSEDLGGFVETILPGAFARAIRQNQDVRALVNHDPSLVLGRTTNGTLQLSEDYVGLKFRCVLPNTQVARDAYELVKRGDVTGCSFAFVAREQSWEETKDQNGNSVSLRKLLDVDLMDVSPVVTYPAYNATSVGVREVDDEDEEDPEFDARHPLFNSARALFPEGIPAEVRSHVSQLRNVSTSEARRRFTNKVLSL